MAKKYTGMSGGQLAEYLGVPKGWVYARGNGRGDLPYHDPRQYRHRYSFDDDLTALWLTERDKDGRWLRDPNVDPVEVLAKQPSDWDGVKGIFEHQRRRLVWRSLYEYAKERRSGVRDVQILAARFGLATGSEETLKSVGMIHGLKTERVRQIEGKAIRLLRHPRRAKKLRQLWSASRQWGTANAGDDFDGDRRACLRELLNWERGGREGPKPKPFGWLDSPPLAKAKPRESVKPPPKPSPPRWRYSRIGKAIGPGGQFKSDHVRFRRLRYAVLHPWPSRRTGWQVNPAFALHRGDRVWWLVHLPTCWLVGWRFPSLREAVSAVRRLDWRPFMTTHRQALAALVNAAARKLWT